MYEIVDKEYSRRLGFNELMREVRSILIEEGYSVPFSNYRRAMSYKRGLAPWARSVISDRKEDR